MNKGQFIASIKQGFSQLINLEISSWDKVRNLDPLPENQTFVSETRRRGATHMSIYDVAVSQVQYNFMLYDYSMFQYYYYNSHNVLSLRYAYYPNPLAIDLEDGYDEGDIKIVGESKRPIIRFDYEEHQYIKAVHPAGHIHIGLYKACRIPVRRILTPEAFILFIVRHFYHASWYRDALNDAFDSVMYPPDQRYVASKTASSLINAKYFSRWEERLFHLE